MRATVLCVGVALLTVSLAGCLGQDDPPASMLTILRSQGFDSLDPALTYNAVDYQYTLATQRTLYAVRPGSARALPDLAARAPAVSADGRTITIRLRRGVRFSPPVNREATAEDVRYAIERAFKPAVAGPHAQAYFGELVGAQAFRRGLAGRITGIEVPDPQTLIFRLRRPYAGLFVGALVLPVTAPVPREYALAFDKRRRSTYASHVAATGPYMVAADPRGRVSGYRPGVRLELVRNPNWSAASDHRPAHLDRIVYRLGTAEDIGLRQALGGSATAAEIIGPPPAFIGREARGPRRRQLLMGSIRATATLTFNMARPPFDDLNVRRAVVAGFNRADVLKLVGGSLTARTASHFIPPGVPGFDEAGAMAGPQLDFLRNAAGDRSLAARYLRRAGYASGRYDGHTAVEVVVPGSQTGGRSVVGEYVQAQLRRLGFRVRLIVDTGGNLCARNEPNACIVGYLPDFPDAQAVLQPAFRGRSGAAPGQNLSRLDDPAVNRAIDHAALVTGTARRARAWARVDRMISALAPAIPLAWPRLPNAFSANVIPVLNDLSGALDLAFTRLRRR